MTRRLLVLVFALVACDRRAGAPARPPEAPGASARQPVAATTSRAAPAPADTIAVEVPFVPGDSTDSLFLRTLPERLEHLLFTNWQADPTHDECGEEAPDGYAIMGMWGLGRIRVLKMVALSPEVVRSWMSVPIAPDSSFHVPRRVDTMLEVVRVISYEGEPSSPYDNAKHEPVVSVRPVIDTITVSWARFTDSWRRCGWANTARNDLFELIGSSSADSIAPGRFTRRTPDATVARAREIADSIARAGSALDPGRLARTPRE